jgi:hypothetical protein
MSGMYVLDAFLMYVRSVRKNEKKGHESWSKKKRDTFSEFNRIDWDECRNLMECNEHRLQNMPWKRYSRLVYLLILNTVFITYWKFFLGVILSHLINTLYLVLVGSTSSYYLQPLGCK